MIPEITITCRKEIVFINSVTVEQYKKYVKSMEINNSEKVVDVMYFNCRIIQEIFGNTIPLKKIKKMDAVEILVAAKGIHFIMQNIISERLLNIVEAESVEKEDSAFDEYDRDNGYEEQQEENEWKACGEIIDRVIKIAIRLLKNSYSQCMKEDILILLDYLKFELDTVNDK